MTMPSSLPANWTTGQTFPASSENSVESAVNWLMYLELNDNFGGDSNGAPSAAASGQSYSAAQTTSGAALSVASGLLSNPNSASSTGWINCTLGGSVVYLEADFAFGGSGTTNNQTLILGSSSATLTGTISTITTSPCYVVFGNSGYSVYYWSSSTQTQIGSTINYVSAQGTNSQHVEVAIDAVNNYVWVRGPDGLVNAFTNSNITGTNSHAVLGAAHTASTDHPVNISRWASSSQLLTNQTPFHYRAQALKQQSMAGSATPTGGAGAEWDSNLNLSANNFLGQANSTATAAGTTTLTIASDLIQVFTGTTTQTVALPTTSVPAGVQYLVVNQSTGAVTVQSSGANTVVVMGAGSSAVFTAAVATPTTAANWNCQYGGLSVVSGKVLTVNNSLFLSGTDGTTMTFPGTTDTVVTLTATQTQTNKRITPRIGTTTSSATPSINTDNYDQFNITALAAAITSMTSGLSGTPTDGQKLLIRILDNGTARAITWGASFGSSGVATLLATTVINKTHLSGFIWDANKSLWVCVAVDTAGY